MIISYDVNSQHPNTAQPPITYRVSDSVSVTLKLSDKHFYLQKNISSFGTSISSNTHIWKQVANYVKSWVRLTTNCVWYHISNVHDVMCLWCTCSMCYSIYCTFLFNKSLNLKMYFEIFFAAEDFLYLKETVKKNLKY